MDRNIITKADAVDSAQAVASWRARDFSRAQALGEAEDGGNTTQGQTNPPDEKTTDAWYKRLLKYIPGEAAGFYLALDRAARSFGLPDPPVTSHDRQITELYLGLALMVGVLFNVLYLRLIWKVARAGQIVVSTLAFVVYVYVTGGVFAPLGWAPAPAQLVVLIICAGFLIFFEPPGPAKTT